MDPKQSGSPLDPKLQEVYDRVMGTNLTPDPNKTTAAQTPTQPVTTQTVPPPLDAATLTPPAMGVQSPMPSPADPAVPALGTTPPVQPVMPVTPMPNADPTQMPSLSPTPQPTPPVQPVMPTLSPDEQAQENLQATMSMPSASQPTETIKIGIGGSPVAAVKAKKKGISPVILIFAALVFLVIYALFWVKFFNYTLPFSPK